MAQLLVSFPVNLSIHKKPGSGRGERVGGSREEIVSTADHMKKTSSFYRFKKKKKKEKDQLWKRSSWGKNLFLGMNFSFLRKDPSAVHSRPRGKEERRVLKGKVVGRRPQKARLPFSSYK